MTRQDVMTTDLTLVTGNVVGNPLTIPLVFKAGGAERMRIATDGTITIPGALTVTGAATLNGATTVGNMTANGTITTAAINSADWIRMSSGTNGIFNGVQSTGINFIPQPALYPSGDIICGLTSTQSLANKTLDYLRSTGAGSVTSGTLDLGQASAAANVNKLYYAKAWGGALTMYCSGAAGFIVGATSYSSGTLVIASGDSYTFHARGDNWWWLV